MIETVITIKLKTSKETFESKEFQEVLNMVKTGELSREFVKGNNKIKPISAACTYWTNYKQQIKNERQNLSKSSAV